MGPNFCYLRFTYAIHTVTGTWTAYVTGKSIFPLRKGKKNHFGIARLLYWDRMNIKVCYKRNV